MSVRGPNAIELGQVESRITKLIDDAILRKDRSYEKIYKRLEEKKQRTLSKYQTKLDDRVKDINENGKNALASINSLVQKGPQQDKASIISSIRNNVNVPLKRIDMDVKNIDTLRREYLEKLGSECGDIELELGQFNPDIPAVEVYAQILENPTFAVQSKLTGPLTINILEFEERYNQFFKDKTLYDLVRQHLDTYHLRSRYQNRTSELVTKCNNSTQIINTKTQDTLNSTRAKLTDDLNKSLPALIEVLSMANMMNNETLQEMIRLLSQLFHIEVDINVGEVDISKDELLADLTLLCDQSQDRERILETALLLGYDISRFETLANDQICSILTRESFL